MSLLSREQVMKSWYAKNPNISFFDLLFALEQHKSISTEYGLNVSIEQHWRLGDPHKKTAAPDRHDYDYELQWWVGEKPYLDLTGISCTDGWLVKAELSCLTTRYIW